MKTPLASTTLILMFIILTAGCATNPCPCYHPAYYDPLPDARKVSCPVLILHGDRDASTPFEHAHTTAEAMRSGGNKEVTVKILADHNHL